MKSSLLEWLLRQCCLFCLLAAVPLQAAEAKYVILFIGDGMHAEAEVATSRYLHGKDFVSVRP